jgi:hypothetical protein
MGMFDYVMCEYALPLPENQGELANRVWHENKFQTKSFDCLLEDYRIHADGTLWQEMYGCVRTRSGRLRRKATGWQPNGHTGIVCFYDAINGEESDYWVEWMATFVSGKLTDVKLDRWEERDNRERLAAEAEWRLEQEKCERFLATWIGRHAYPF